MGTALCLFQEIIDKSIHTSAIWNVRGLAAVRRCHAEESGDCNTKS
jgi:hypothetical protein